MKKLINKYKKLSLAIKIQLVIALLCTMAIPVFAWFAYQDRVEAFTKVKEPPSINLASGGDDPALYITLENIDVSKSTEKFIVFSVEPGKYPTYDIQLSHTTNIPFTYELYRVKEDENGSIEYTDHTRNKNVEGTTIKYDIIQAAAGTQSGKLSLEDINPDNGSTGRTLGNEDSLSVYNRKNYTADDSVNQYVKPIYSVARNISRLNESEDGNNNRDYYAIKLKWVKGPSELTENDSGYWNYAYNNKETDIIYISAKQSATAGNP